MTVADIPEGDNKCDGHRPPLEFQQEDMKPMKNEKDCFPLFPLLVLHPLHVFLLESQKWVPFGISATVIDRRYMRRWLRQIARRSIAYLTRHDTITHG
jgi:hypothetical protein